ncbi:ATP-binding protein [[Mycobacterium] appelbergii]|uniref:ATP-binding protein n=1 Tax=[Mycobacterium] appelbergii TaxID=2939269 RepID=UPI002938D198|nr:adenylate/guanylate cyclase domain-containing protein [Mycobacterium sp. 21AC1]
MAEPTPAEYKQVTVLFADVVRSMGIASALGAERLREIMTELFNLSAAVVQRYGGTVDKFTGDGIMALFGAPVALEDHAFRACLTALEIQTQAGLLAAQVQVRDGVTLQLRIGLDSGQVIAGEFGSSAVSYTAIGEHVGMAQRMESIAPAGGVMLSDSTARLTQDHVILGEPQRVHIKGFDEPISARLLRQPKPNRSVADTDESPLVGRQWELTALEAMLERSIHGHGCVVAVTGPPGIGKSRLVQEVITLAATRGVEVYSSFCESHTSGVPFYAIARLLRAGFGVAELGRSAARTKVRAQVPEADPEDLKLLDDLLGIAEPDSQLPQIDPDARRRRLTKLVNAASLARTTAAVYVIEDAHWIDTVSESMLADFLAVTPQTPSLMLITYRPDYRGALTALPSSQTIALAPLDDLEISMLVSASLGTNSEVRELSETITSRAAGNPFFAMEITRDLAERGLLDGERGAYVLRGEPGAISVPATLQSAIAARIDRLAPNAKRTLTAAAVIGSRFTADLLSCVGIEPAIDELIESALIAQVRFTPQAEFAFHHPLVRTVAYESQLRSDRAVLHRRLAAAIESAHPASADENAALIAQHLEAAGDLRDAYSWHMRAATWSTNRDVAAAQVSWERAGKIADALPDDDADRLTMRIAPRTLSCANAFRAHIDVTGARFDELRELCDQAGDKASLAVAMAGLIGEHFVHGNIRDGVLLASEHTALIESLGDPTLFVGLSVSPIAARLTVGDIADVARWSQLVIDLADGDLAKGGIILGAPLAAAYASRSVGRWALGRPGWHEDIERAVTMVRGSDPMSLGVALTYGYCMAIGNEVLLPDNNTLLNIDEALSIAERSADDIALGFARMTKGIALLYRGPEHRAEALDLLQQVHEMCVTNRFYLAHRPVLEVWIAHGSAMADGHFSTLPLLRDAYEELFSEGQFAHCIVTSQFLAEMLIARGADGDLREAADVVDRLAAVSILDDWVTREVTLLRLRALLCRANGDEDSYRHLRDRYREKSNALGYEGHMALAAVMD